MAQAIVHMAEIALYLTPLFLIGALVLSGRYPGEERIVARWRGAVRAVARRRTHQWRPQRVIAPRSLLEGGAVGVRGPPMAS